jgi:DNA topoisomerase-1
MGVDRARSESIDFTADACRHNRNSSNRECLVPARKKPADDAVAKAGRKKPSTTKAVAKASTTRKRSAAPATANGDAAGARGGQDLVIVESPGKVASIGKYLGAGYKVLASYGHIRDLPRRRKKGEAVAGVDIPAGWKATYEVVKDEPGHKRRVSKKEVIDRLRREAKTANRVYLATDRDREGEAIAWHIEQELKLDPARTYRISFNEITRPAIQQAIANPGQIDLDRVQAQEARRILDRVVGYPLSGLLGKKVGRGLSAGRVQSVAVRLVVEREREIEAFKAEEYWKLTALLSPAGTVPVAGGPYEVILAKKKGEKQAEADAEAAEKPVKEAAAEHPEGTFFAELAEWAGKKYEAGAGATCGSEEAARAIAARLDTAAYKIRSIEQKDRSERPHAPFTTSTLQQQANIRLRLSAKRTMDAAQRLYEGVALGSEGTVALITYMRTDSTRISDEALKGVRAHIEANYGGSYLPAKPNYYASGKSAQEAHEAVRPTDLSFTPQRVAHLGLTGDQLRLYTLIYNRFVACQMAPAVFAVTNVEVLATPKEGTDVGVFKAQGRILKFDGYRKVYTPGGKQEDAELPHLTADMPLDKHKLTASQHFTQPPPRYNEASLVKALEKEGIGRPSTYATIITKIQDRKYVEQRDRRFFATDLGKKVTDFLVELVPDVMDLKFTSGMEEKLDQIESGERVYREVLDDFWPPFSQKVSEAESTAGSLKAKETGEMCPKCGKPLVEQHSRKTGRTFIGCSGFRKEDGGCTYIKGQEDRPEAAATGVDCPNCGKPMLQRFSRRGPFLGCSGYPECKTTMNLDAEGKPQLATQPTKHLCEKCGKPLVVRQGRRGPFLSCSGYPECKNAMDCDAEGNPIRPIESGIACEKCGSPMIVKPKGVRGPYLACSGYPKCRAYKPLPPELKEKFKDVLPAAPLPGAAKKPAGPTVEVTETCPQCDAPMKVRQGRTGPFLGCSKYPKCKGTREATPELLEKLQETGAM